MWTDYTSESLIILDPDVKSKAELFEKMVNHVYNQDLVVDRKAFLRALLEREEKSNTELTPGVALPHARSDECEKLFLCILVLREGLDYGNPEMGPARLVFFFGTPQRDNRQYLQLLAKSSRLLKNPEFRQKLLEAQTARDVLDLLARHDQIEQESGESTIYSMQVVLHERKRLDDLLGALVELGITNALVIDGQSMARKMAYEMPVFAGLSYLSPGKSKETTMVVCTVRDRNLGLGLFNLLRENGIDLNRPNQGYIRLIRVDELIGNPEETLDL
ncbi:MAG: PTS sugar transporter subunit IIA [Candidatus Cloacimonetes bacterium]|nr:PTS sugar transporter subunit IIA [Candidatus Cloacimonadota bacterium]